MDLDHGLSKAKSPVPFTSGICQERKGEINQVPAIVSLEEQRGRYTLNTTKMPKLTKTFNDIQVSILKV